MMHMKDAFWLAAFHARPNQHELYKNFHANLNIFFGNHIQRLYAKRGRRALVVQIFNDGQQVESGNRRL